MVYLAGAAMAAGAIVLVDDDRVRHISHDCVPEGDLADEPSTCPRPRLYPKAILGPREMSCLNRDILHPFFLPRSP